MLIVGEKEELDNSVSIRKHGEGDQGVMSILDFVNKINEEIKQSILK